MTLVAYQLIFLLILFASVLQKEREDMEADNELREGTEDNQIFIPKTYAALRKVCHRTICVCTLFSFGFWELGVAKLSQ